jgi:hypothetical protein
MPCFCADFFKDRLLQRFVSRFASCHTDPLRRVINAAVRFVAGFGSRDQSKLHWLPIDQRVNYKLCVITHTVVRGTAPEYVSLQCPHSAGAPTCAQPLLDSMRSREQERSWALKHYLSQVPKYGTVYLNQFTLHSLNCCHLQMSS